MKYAFAGSAVAGAAVVVVGMSPSLRRLVSRAVVNAQMPDDGARSLLPTTQDTVVDFARALLGDDIEPGHYRAMFGIRAATIPGHGELIERFARDLDTESERAFGRTFSQLEPERRIRQASELESINATATARLTATVLQPSWVLFNLHIVRPMILQFARSDAWLELGYDAYPGYPRELSSYTRKPRGGLR